ncbi:MAG: DUF2180 family protein [Candidatus Aenigmatarchaeota archaeon]
MKCWFCEKEARGTCIFCGRGVYHEHGYKDTMTHTKSDTSTGFASYFKVENALKCMDCKPKWENWEQGKMIIK